MTVDDEQASVILNDWLLSFMVGDPQATVPNLMRVLRDNDAELDELRAKAAGWHFAKEALTEREREILVVAEAMLRLLDGESV